MTMTLLSTGSINGLVDYKTIAHLLKTRTLIFDGRKRKINWDTVKSEGDDAV